MEPYRDMKMTCIRILCDLGSLYVAGSASHAGFMLHSHENASFMFQCAFLSASLYYDTSACSSCLKPSIVN